jgi:hypothetical protein
LANKREPERTTAAISTKESRKAGARGKQKPKNQRAKKKTKQKKKKEGR